MENATHNKKAHVLVRYSSIGPKQHRLIIFPGAGQGAPSFKSFPTIGMPKLDIWAVDLPGRGQRLSEQPTSDLRYLTSEISSAITSLPALPTTLFGHSMGALLATYLAQILEMVHHIRLARLIVSANLPPRSNRAFKGELTRPDFDERVKSDPKYAGLDGEASNALYELLRQDLALARQLWAGPRQRVNCPIMAYGGASDPDIPPESLSEWSDMTRSTFEYKIFSGNHMFLFQEHGELRPDVTADILSTITELHR